MKHGAPLCLINGTPYPSYILDLFAITALLLKTRTCSGVANWGDDNEITERRMPDDSKSICRPR
jgi:hypothetical protein